MSTISQVRIPVTTTGSAGSATGTASSGAINGLLYDLYVKYHASAPAGTTDVTISETGGAARTFLTLTNTATSGSKPVRIPAVDATGAANSTADHAHALGGTSITVTVAQSDALTNCVEVYAYILE